MGQSTGRLIALAAALLAFARLFRVLQPAITGPPWPLVLVATLAAGYLAGRLLGLTRPGSGARWLVNGPAVILITLWVSIPGDLVAGVLPGAGSIDALGTELGIAVEIIRFGAAPVLPVPGLVAILAIIFWALGSLAGSRRPSVGALSSLTFYLQLATLDRTPPGSAWMSAFLIVAGAAILSMRIGPGRTTGRARSTGGAPIPPRSTRLAVVTLSVAVTIAAVGASALAAAVPQSGTLQWRTQSGIGTGLYGSGSFNQFVGLQQSLLNLSDDPMFYARVNDSAPSQLYWRLLTLDTFDGRFWSPSDQTFARRGDPRWENPEWSFRGPTAPVAANVLIAGLKTSEFLPTLYSPVGLTSEEPLISEGFRVREDGSVAVDLRVLESWTYQINAEIPQPELAALASVDGALSGTFAAAVAAGELDLEPAPGTATERPESLDAYTELPEIDEALGELARSVTAGATTPFERAVLLETFLRDPALGFTYSTQVDTGHSALDLTEWLTEPDSRNFRTGYCEQFATAMAVMGRMLRIPTRVVLGFTPGSIEQQADGTDIIVVRERNAHAWVEMWMDGQGWVKFDPTPLSDSPDLSLTSSRVGVDLRPFVPEPTALSATPGVPQIPREDLIDPGRFGAGSDVEGLGGLGGSLRRLSSWALVVLVLAALVALVPGAKYMRRRRRLARMSDGEVEAAWAEIVDRLADLGVPPDPADTPLEMARAEDHDLVPLALLYEAAAYGGRTAARCLPAFEQAERNLRTRYSGGPWTKSWVSLESVAPRRLLRFSLRTRQRSSRR